MRIKRWEMAPLDKALAAEMAESCELNPFLALLLTARGLTSPEEILRFLTGQDEEADPFAFADMDVAAERIQTAIDRHERILIYGDYDVDGITATALLYTYLQRQGADVLYRLPLRENGYGLHAPDIAWAAQQGVQLIVTVDTGISLTPAETAAITGAGMELVVTDHHQPPAQLPAAVAVVDPQRADCESPCKDYAGVGVAFMLLCALEGDGESILQEYGDLLTLGTLADAMPLRGFMRDLMRRGVQLLNDSRRPGIVALRQVAGCAEKPLTATGITFTLAPRLNAAGRMADPDVAFRLLVAADEATAQPLAAELQQLNGQRQEVSRQVLAQAEAQLAENPLWLYDRLLLVCGDGWQNGVLGIVAARLTEKYGKPAFVLSAQGEMVHGSGRSLPGFSLVPALEACAGVVEAYGGHDQAAGLTVRRERVDDLRRALNRYAAAACPQMPTAALSVALRLRPGQIDTEKLALLEVLEPYGSGNPAPLFALCNMRLDNITALGGGKHLRLSMSRDGVRVNVMKFQTTPQELPIPCGSLVNCIVSLEKNEYRGILSVSLCARDIGYAATDREALAADIALFESVMRREAKPAAETILPDRPLLARLYTLLHRCGVWQGTLEHLQYAAARTAERQEAPVPVPALRLLAALELWREAGLLQVEDRGECLCLTVLPVQNKADLAATPLWQYLAEEG